MTTDVGHEQTQAAVKTARKNLRLLDDFRLELDQRERTFLRSRGWRHTSSTPRFMWMWARDLHGVRILTDQEGALSIERAILSGDAPSNIGDFL